MKKFGKQKEDEFGALFQARSYGQSKAAESGDQHVMVPRSGSTGYRGGKPSYGAVELEGEMAGQPFRFKSDSLTALALAGLGVLVVVTR